MRAEIDSLERRWECYCFWLVGSLLPPTLQLLVVDDEPGIRQMLEILFRREGYAVVVAPGYRHATEAIAQSPHPFPVVITDLKMPDGSGLDVLAAAKSRHSHSEVIMITAHSTVDNAIEAVRAGAYDFVAKPFDPSELVGRVARAFEKHALSCENVRLRALVSERARDRSLGRSAAMQAITDLIQRVAPSRSTVLITGESGTGKERVARAVHDYSDRKSAPFLVVNCGALPEALMESELFGHEKGAFTGAATRHLGMFREADGGTILLDEVGELPAALQVKLLRVLQERKVRPVGAAHEIPIDVRVLAATNRDIEADVASGAFRQDLYYRLNVIRIELPPLRARREDLPHLIDEFIRKYSAEMGREVACLTPDALRSLDRYDFPGNVRELENIIERAVALSGGRAIGLGDLPSRVVGLAGSPTPNLVDLPEDGCDLDAVLGELERRLLISALERTGGVRKHAASLLGVTFRSIRYRLKKHGLDVETACDEDETSDEPPSSEPAALTQAARRGAG
jgi:two-component system response regulator PilR (NtrC family)